MTRIFYTFFLTFFLFIFIGSLKLNCNNYPFKKEMKKNWKLKNFPIQSAWNRDDKKIPFVLASIPKDVPTRFLLQNIPTPGNQGNQASGTAWALGYFAASYLYENKGTNIDNSTKSKKKQYQCAPAFVYNRLNKGIDRGIEIVSGLELLKKEGCPEENYMPYNSADSAHRASGRAIQNARQYKINGFGRIDYTDLDQVRGHLLQNKPIIITLLISENFITLDEFVWKKPAGNSQGYHSVSLIGYDDKKRLFFFLNSVGSKWGNNGKAAIPYSWFFRLTKKAYILW